MNRFLEPVELRPRPGRALAPYVVSLVLLSLLAIARSDVSDWTQLALAIGIGARIGWACLRNTFRGGDTRVERAVLRADGTWQVLSGSGSLVGGQLARAWGTSAGPVVGIEWRCEDGLRRRTWVTRRDLSAAAWRRLRARLLLA